jgi:hypothetical protein
MCATIGTILGICCNHSTWPKMVAGALFGMFVYLCFSWLFQSEASMEFAKIFNKTP